MPCYRVRIACNLDKIRPKPDKTADMLTAWGLGLVAPGAVTDVLDAEPMKRPPDLKEDFAFWEATVLEKKKSTTAAPPGGSAMGVGVPPNGHPPPVEHQIPPGGVPARPAQGTAPAGPTTASLALPAALAAEIAPGPLRAAESHGDTSGRSALAAALATLTVLDQRLFAAISAAAQADLRRAYSEVGRRVSRAMPARSALRTKIRDVPDAEKWAALSDADRALVNLDIQQVVAGQFDELRTQAQAEMRTVLVAADARLGDAGYDVQRDPMAVEHAGALLVAGMTALLASRLISGSDSDAVPDAIPIETMLAAGGARVDAGRVSRDSRGVPLAADGTADALGTGAANGPSSMRALRGHVQWRWVHGLYRTPQEPYEPHMALHDHISAAPVPIHGQYPGDHPWCSCGFVPEVL